jgi:hypothetical protein
MSEHQKANVLFVKQAATNLTKVGSLKTVEKKGFIWVMGFEPTNLYLNYLSILVAVVLRQFNIETVLL